MNKRGFTLVELLAVIALVAVIMLLVVPAVSSSFGGSLDKVLSVQRNEIKDAAKLYLNDYCLYPLSGNTCTLTRNNDFTYSGTISLATLVSANYIENVKLNNDTCTGCIVFTNNDAFVHLKCGERETTNYSCS